MRARDAGTDRGLSIRCRLVMSQTACRFCGASVEAVFADLGMSPLANSYLPPERVNAWSPSTRCARWSARVLPGAAGGVRDARADLLRLRLLLLVLVELAGAQPPYAEQMIERFGLGEREPRRGDRLQRRLPAAVLPRAPDPRARDRAGGQRGQGRAAEGHPDAGGVLRARDGAVAGRRVGRRPAARQQRARARPRSQRLRGGHEDPAQARRRDHDGVPASDAPDRGQPVGHDLPRALLLLLLPHRQPRVRGARPAPVRRRGAAHARRLAAHLRRPRRGRGEARERGGARAARARARGRLRAARHLPRLRPSGRGGQAPDP